MINTTKTIVCSKCGEDDAYQFQVTDNLEIECCNCHEIWGEAIPYK